MKKLLIVSLLASASALALAKLPAPPADDAAKAKAAEAAAKAAWAGKETKPATATPACAEPGAFVYPPPEAAKPLEASGAHSPTATAASPPSSKTPAAEIAPAKKP